MLESGLAKPLLAEDGWRTTRLLHRATMGVAGVLSLRNRSVLMAQWVRDDLGVTVVLVPSPEKLAIIELRPSRAVALFSCR